MDNISSTLIKSLVKNKGKTLAQTQLEKILDTDIHESSLGCKIANTHIRIGKVHLDTFYEAQLLFGNSYWTDVFSFYFYRFIKQKIKDNINLKNRPIILYGYETYSTLTLNKTLAFLEKDGLKAYLRIFEVKDNRVRYCDERNSTENSQDSGERTQMSPDSMILENNPILFFFVGISSTLSTFKHMNNNLLLINSDYGKTDKFCISIIQVIGQKLDIEGSNDPSEQFLELGSDEFGEYVLSKYMESYLDFIPDAKAQKVYYYVSTRATWYIANQCKLCMPRNFLEEKPLIEVDESSVVPTQMIRLNKSNSGTGTIDPIEVFSKDNSEIFINDISNRKYLHYDHIERNGNHHQYYFRLSRLYHDKRNDIEEWLKAIKTGCHLDRMCSSYEFTFCGNKIINIIVAPQHFSNTGFVNSVNNIVFNGTAHIIEFDINKEFRSNFKAKYNNYCELEKIISELTEYKINFYYVNDQIVSGTTFYRAKSLINSLFSTANNEINVFKGVFVLFDRNSFETRKNYVQIVSDSETGTAYLPYFSYLKIDIPSLRNYNDSCPLCFNKLKALDIIDECALDKTAFYWQEKIIYHRQKNVEEIRNIQISDNDCLRHYRRFQCENDLWRAVKEAYSEISANISDVFAKESNEFKRDTIISNFYNCINHRLNQSQTDNEKIEYLISYLKTMSRALLYYQEDVKKAVFEILLHLFDYFISTNLCGELPIGENKLNINFNSCSTSLKCDLFCIIITCLCGVGSCVLLDYNRLMKCREIGKKLKGESESKKGDFDSFLLNNIKKLLCYDKGNSKAMLTHNMFQSNNLMDKINSGFGEDFFIRLYLENTRAPSLYRDNDVIKKIQNLQNDDYKTTQEGDAQLNETEENDTSNDDIKKYKKLSQILIDVATQDVITSERIYAIEFFAVHNDEVVNITGGEMAKPSHDLECFAQEDDIYYIGVGNNFSQLMRLKDYTSKKSLEEILKSELKLIKNAHIIIGIRANSIEPVAKVLKYRKEILELVETDFNNDAISNLIVLHRDAEILSEVKTVSHHSKPLIEFDNLFEMLPGQYGKITLNDSNASYYLALQRKLLSIYMDTVISIAYREKLRKEQKFMAEDDPGMFIVDYNPLDNRLEYAKVQIVIERGTEIDFQIGEMHNKEFNPYPPETQEKLRKAFKTEYNIIRFRESEGIGDPYLIIKTFIDNAFNHCLSPQVSIKLSKEQDDSYTLIVENTITERTEKTSNKHITLKAMKYIFKDSLKIPEGCEKLENGSIFKIELNNFIVKK